MTTSLESLDALRHNHWVQNIAHNHVEPVTFPGLGTCDVDQTLFGLTRKGVYFPDFPNLNLLKSGALPNHEAAIKQARTKGLVVGFSGYATGKRGFDYGSELVSIETIFQTFKRRNRPISLAMHGGTREGIPVLANLVAIADGVDSMGLLPTRGLDWLPEPFLDYLVVKGQNWGDESELLGGTPDVVFLFGGGANAMKDCQAALAQKRKLIAVALKEYPQDSAINTIPTNSFTQVCTSLDELINCVRTISG